MAKSSLKRCMQDVLFVGGPYDGQTRKVHSLVTRSHVLRRGTIFKDVYRRNPDNSLEMLYEGEFERDTHQLRFP